MNIKGIAQDSLKYSFSNWKRLLILGIFILINTVNYTFQALGIGMLSLFDLGIFSLIFGVLAYGYGIRVLKSSLAGFEDLPEFNAVFNMIIDGIMVIIVGIAYTIPLILILGLALVGLWIFNIISVLYLIVAFPIFLMSLANMAFYDSNLGAAFKFREIFNKISSIGWSKFIILYIVTIIISLILIFAGGLIEAIFTLISFKIIGVLLIQLILIPYIIIYVFRSIALFYLSESPGYLECDNCRGYYELQHGESPNDFEACHCGGNLKHIKSLDNELEGENSNNQSFSGKLKSLFKKRNLAIVGVLALIVVILSAASSHNVISTNKTLVGTYNMEELGSNDTLVLIPPGTTSVKIEYNLSWAPVETGNNAVGVYGYNTNKTGWDSLPDNMNIIYQESISLDEGDENKTGTWNLNNQAIRSIVISGNGAKGTIKIYAYQMKITI